jgi:uncharacterized protein involved in type VI secretion and phage assembly
MPTATLRMYLDNTPASQAQLAGLGTVRVDQGIGVATEAQIELPVGTDDGGVWQRLEDPDVQAFARIRVEVRVGEGDYVALVDGPVVGQRWQLDATPESSMLTLLVHDDSVLLNRDEAVALYEDQSPSDIAAQLFSEAGLQARVDAVPLASAAFRRYAVQRGTPMAMLRRLARDNGMFAYVEPGDAAGHSVGIFERPLSAPNLADALPELVLLGPSRNIGRFTAEFDAQRPQAPQTATVQASDRSVLQSAAATSAATTLGAQPAHQTLTPAVTLLSRTREEQSDLDAATGAGADLSAWAWTAQGEVQADGYAGVLRPYRKLQVRGVGGQLSGEYLISRVQHEITAGGYRQQFSLTRNARSAGAGAALPSLAGVF